MPGKLRQALITAAAMTVVLAAVVAYRGSTADPAVPAPTAAPVSTSNKTDGDVVFADSGAERAFQQREAAYRREAETQKQDAIPEDCWGNKVEHEVPRSTLVWEEDCPSIRAEARRAKAERRRKAAQRRAFLAGGPPTRAQITATPEPFCGDNNTCPLLEVRARAAVRKVMAGVYAGRTFSVGNCTRQSPWRIVCDFWGSADYCRRLEGSEEVIQPRYQRELLFRRGDPLRCVG